MLKSKANWKLLNEGYDEETTSRSSIIERLFLMRDLTTDEAIEKFINPNLEDIQDASFFSQITVAKDRVLKAIKNDEKIIVYGDYDADGVTSTALLVSTLLRLGANCDYTIPNRFTEGYGLHQGKIEMIAERGYDLIITVDNGIANIEEVAYANDLGLDVIITDHHEIQAELPDAYAIIHPKLSAEYQFKELAGVGVALQFATFLLDEMPKDLLDFVAIGTIADLVPLLGENRILTYYGLKQLNDTQHLGLKTLMTHCRLTENINEKDVGFMIAPRLNAVGRIDNAEIAVKLLLTDDIEEAEELTNKIDVLNSERQKIVQQIVAEASKQVDKRDNFIILYDDNWHEGVLGIAASRLVTKFERPVMMLTYKAETNELKGSARSIAAFNLFENCMEIRELFTNFGGHSQAAGMTFPFENLPLIKKALNEKIAVKVKPEDLKIELQIHDQLALTDMTEKLVKQIDQFAPFGMANPQPLFLLEDLPTQIRQIGQDNKHLKIQFKTDQRLIDAVGFNFGSVAPLISNTVDVSLVGYLNINEWNGNRTVQMMVEDLAVNEWQLFDYRGKRSFSNIVPFLKQFSKSALVTTSIETLKDTNIPDGLTLITYDAANTNLAEVDILFIKDLPNDLGSLENIVRQTKPQSVHINYQVIDNAYLEAIPSREEFKWLYGYLLNYQPVNLQVDLLRLSKLRAWSQNKLIFMLKVFLDLEFIKIEQNIVTVNRQAAKQDLQQSTVFQKRLAQSEVEKVLYYNSYEEVKKWFQEKSVRLQREEVTHGF